MPATYLIKKDGECRMGKPPVQIICDNVFQSGTPEERSIRLTDTLAVLIDRLEQDEQTV